MPVERMLPTPESEDLIARTRELAAKELAPRAAPAEEAGTFPREVFRLLGRAGLLGLPFPEEDGGGGQPYEVYLQVLEEIASVWASAAVGVTVHTASCLPLWTHGTEEQRKRLPDMLDGDLLGGYALSEAHSGPDAASLATRAVPDDHGYRVTGTKSWITHGGEADFYVVFARTSEDKARGVSCFMVDGEHRGLTFGPPDRKLGLTGSTTTRLHFDDAFVPAEWRIGEEGQGFPIALSALDAGRLGIAACAVGLAQGALDHAVAHAVRREQFGRPIIANQGLSFLLADMAAAVESARATYLEAARRKDRGLPCSRQASIAKLVATDAAMKVAVDAVQILGGHGYTRDFPVERYMREAKVMQIFEGSNQIQRMVIGRHLAASADH